MARIIAPTEPSVGLTTPPAPRPDPGAFGATTGRAFQQAGATLERASGEIGQVALQKQNLLNETAVNDAYANHFSPQFRSLYQDYYSKQGKAALDAQPEYQQKMNDLRQQVRDTLANPAQQRMFDQVARRRVEMELDGMSRYADQQGKQWAAQTSDATLKNVINDAADKYNDEHAFGTALGHGLAEIDRYATATGQSAEVTRARADKFISDAWVQRITASLVHDPEQGQALYDANQKQIDAPLRAALEEKIKHAVMPVQARNDAATIMGHPDHDLSATQVRAQLPHWLDAAEKVAAKRYPNDPVYRDLLENQLTHYVGRIATAQESVARNARNSLLTAALMPNANGEKPGDINALLSNPALKDAWTRLEPDQQLGVLHVLKENAKGDDPPETLHALSEYHRLRGLAINDPAGFQQEMGERFNTIGKTLPRSLFLQLIQQDTAIDKGQAKQLSAGLNVSHIHTATDGLLQAAGFTIPTKKETRKDVLNAYQEWTSRMLDSAQRFQEEHKRKPNDKDLRELGQQLLQQGYQPGTGFTWFGHTFGRKTVRAFQVQPGNLAVPAPPDEAEKIRAAYRTTFHRDPTDAEVDQWYAVGQQQGKR